jgi:DMSO/TMAO reductase YedYZ molybdopterin-dependent catalytic subunit
LLAFKLNGQFLPENHGFPLRALLPGWYAMDSVKWLRRIVVLGPDDPVAFERESGMDRLYHRMAAAGGDRVTATRLSEIQIKSVIASPQAWPRAETTLPGGKQRVWGFAWTGAALVRSVEMSTDGGESWRPAMLEGAARPFTWVRWSCEWDARPGEHVLMSRASDDQGNRQQIERDPLRRDGYELNWCAPLRCTVI